MQPLHCASGEVEPELGATAAGLGSCFTELRSCRLSVDPEEEAALNNHSAQSPASVCVSSPGHAMGHLKVKCSFCNVQLVWWSLKWGLQQGWSGGLGVYAFAGLWRFPEEEAVLGNHSAQSSASVRVASPGHTMGHCEVKCSICTRCG